MKSLKVLMMIAGFSTVVVASEGTADQVVIGYMQQGMNLLGSFGSYVSTKGSELSDVVSKQASECAQHVTDLASSGYNAAIQTTTQVAGSVADYAKVGMDHISTKSTNIYDNSVKFIQDNPKSVGVATIMATVMATAAVYRKLTLGYVFYKSEKNDQN